MQYIQRVFYNSGEGCGCEHEVSTTIRSESLFLSRSNASAGSRLGARDQALQQAVLDAQRQSNLQLYQLPFQQYSFLSDIYKGTPSSQQVTQMTQTQDPSTFQQIAGLGIAGLSAAGGAKALNLF